MLTTAILVSILLAYLLFVVIKRKNNNSNNSNNQTTINNNSNIETLTLDNTQWINSIKSTLSVIDKALEQNQDIYASSKKDNIDANINKKDKGTSLRWLKIINKGTPIVERANQLYRAYNIANVRLNVAIDFTKDLNTDNITERSHQYKNLFFKTNVLTKIEEKLHNLTKEALEILLEIDSAIKISARQKRDTPSVITELQKNLTKLTEFYYNSCNKSSLIKIQDAAEGGSRIDYDVLNVQSTFEGAGYINDYTKLILTNNTDSDKMIKCREEWSKLINSCFQYFNKINKDKSYLLDNLNNAAHLIIEANNNNSPLAQDTIKSIDTILSNINLAFNGFDFDYKFASNRIEQINALIYTQNKIDENSIIPNTETVQKIINELKSLMDLTKTTLPDVGNQFSLTRIEFLIMKYTYLP